MRFIAPFILALIPSLAPAAVQFNMLSDGDLEMLTKEFSAITDYTSVGAASSMPLWGKELGVVVGRTDTWSLSSIVMRSGSPNAIDWVPHGSLFGSLTFPHSVAVEVSWLPYTPFADGSIQLWGIGLKWTITDEYLKNFPLDAAIKIKFSNLDLSFSETINNSDATVDFQDSVLGLEFYISAAHSSGLIEVYGAVGYLQAWGLLNVNGPGNPSVAIDGSQSMNSTPSSLQLLLGANLYPVSFLDIGIEVSHEFDRNSLNMKLSALF